MSTTGIDGISYSLFNSGSIYYLVSPNTNIGSSSSLVGNYGQNGVNTLSLNTNLTGYFFNWNVILAGGGISTSINGGHALYVPSGFTLNLMYNYGYLLGGGGYGALGGNGGAGGGGGCGGPGANIGGGVGGSLLAAPVINGGGGGGPAQAGENNYNATGGGGNGFNYGGYFNNATNGGVYYPGQNGAGGGYGGGSGGSQVYRSGGGGGGGGRGGTTIYASGGNGGYSIYNTGTITSLYNLQGGRNRYGPLFYGGTLPINYYIRVNSQTNYGQLYCTGWAWSSVPNGNAMTINIDPASTLSGNGPFNFYNVFYGLTFTTFPSGTVTLNGTLYYWLIQQSATLIYYLTLSNSFIIPDNISYNPATISTAFSSGTYRHVVMTISGSTHTLYLDSQVVATNTIAGNAFATYSSLSNLYLGSAADLSFGYTGIIDDFKIWNRALPAADISLVFQSNITKYTLIDNLSSTTQSAMLYTGSTLSAGAYGLVLLYSKYSGPVMTIRRSSDSVSANFYADTSGNLGTGYFASGTSLAAWLNTATAFVSQWWDQTGNGNHATQSTTTAQPVYNITGKYIDLSNFNNGGNTNAFFNLPTGAHPYGDSEYTYVFKYSSTNTTYGLFGGGASATDQTNNLAYYPFMYNNFWYSDDEVYGSTYIENTNNVISCKFSKTPTRTRSLFLNGSSVSGALYIGGTNIANNISSNTRNQASSPNYLGLDTQSRYLNGRLYYSYIIPTAISDADRNILEATPTTNYTFIPPTSVIDTLTSTTKTAILKSTTTLSAGAYGVVLLYGGYMGPVMTIRRSSDSVSANFYADLSGNLGLGYFGSGTSLSTWLSTSTAFVTQWWDQTGNANHATQSTTANQPTYNTTNNFVTFTTTSFFNLPNGTHPFNDSPYTYVFKCAIPTATGGIFSGGTTVQNQSHSFRRDTNNYMDSWYANNITSSGNTYADNSVISVWYNGATRKIYKNTNQIATLASSGRQQPNTNNVIGKGIDTDLAGGYIYYMYIAPIDISDVDRNKLEATYTNPIVYIAPILILAFENNLNNTGTAVGISSLSISGTLAYTTGKKGVYSASFNFTQNITFTFTTPTFPISYSFWINPNAIEVSYGLISIGFMYFAINGAGSGIGGDPNNSGPRIPGLLTFYSSSFSTYTDNTKFYTTAGYQNTGGVCCALNVWTHIVWVANTSTNWTVYVNKVPYTIDVTANPLSFASSVTCSIGPGKRNWYNGLLDSFQLYNGYALTQSDVNNLYTN